MTRDRSLRAGLAAAVLGSLLAGASALAQGGAAGQGGLSPDTPVIAPAPAGPNSGPGAQSGPKTPLPPRDTPRAPQPGQKAAAQDADWPCVQVRVGSLSYGQMWAGPPIEEALQKWREDKTVDDLVDRLVARRTKMEDAKAAIDAFAQGPGSSDAKLTLLFAGVFDELNSQRSRIISGIERYARKQRELSERIKQESLRIASQPQDMATQNSPEALKQQEALNWDTRIYDERAHSLTYVCETPVILEQRAFDLGREIQSHLKQAQ